MTTNDTQVRLDKTPPEFSLISMVTNNIYGDSLAGLGTIDTLSFTTGSTRSNAYSINYNDNQVQRIELILLLLLVFDEPFKKNL